MNQTEYSPEAGEELSPFSRLIAMLAGIALQQMGRIPDPVSGRPIVRLQDAQAFIDILEELQRKTRGNLSPEEDRFLGETLASLRLTFVSVVNQSGQAHAAAPGAESTPPPPESARPSPETAPPGPSAEPGRQQTHDSKVRFRKSYG